MLRDILAPGLLGLVFFALLLRPGILDPHDLQWLGVGDAAQHLIGLHYFVQDPWQFPPGMFTSYGDGVPTSVVYTDSVPLLAIPWKALLRSFGITTILQPFGAFIALCFVLQGIFGFRLLRKLSGETGIALLGLPLLFICAPLLYRLPMHLALGAQWLVLWALELAAFSGAVGWRKNRQWLALLGIALGIHFYIFVMCAALYGAALLAALLRGRLKIARCGAYAAVFVILVAVEGWLLGYFVPVDPQRVAGAKFNLLGFFNPMGWSRWINEIPIGGRENEGMAWIGMGLLLLAVLEGCVPPRLFEHKRRLDAWESSLMIGGVTALLAVAITPSVNLSVLSSGRSMALIGCVGAALYIGTAWGRFFQWRAVLCELISSPVSCVATLLVLGAVTASTVLHLVPIQLFNMIRASGRMVWPCFYWLTCWMIARSAQCFGKPAAYLVLCGCVALQAFDMAPKLSEKRWEDFRQGGLSRNSCALASPVITDALWNFCDGKKRLWVVTQKGDLTEVDRLGLLAIQKGVAINHPYLARFSKVATQRRENEIMQTLQRKAIPSDTVYYIYPDGWKEVEAIMANKPGEVEFVAENGFAVLKRAQEASEALASSNREKWKRTCPVLPLELGKPLSFMACENVASHPGTVGGFSVFGYDGAWTDQSSAWVRLKMPGDGGNVRLSCTLCPQINPHTAPGQLVRVLANGEPVGEWAFTREGEEVREVVIPSKMVPPYRIVELRFDIAYPTSPNSLGRGPDIRELGFRMLKIECLGSMPGESDQ